MVGCWVFMVVVEVEVWSLLVGFDGGWSFGFVFGFVSFFFRIFDFLVFYNL